MGYTQKLGLLAQSVFSDASLNVGIGAAPSGTYKLDVTGTGRFTGALTGTSATFSSSVTSQVTANAAFLATSGTTSRIYSQLNNTGGNAFLGVESSTGGNLFTGSSAYATVLGNDAARSLEFATNNNIRLSIASTGAATFSSSVTAGSYLATQSGNELRLYNGLNNSNIQLFNSAGTGASNFNIYNATTSTYYLTISSTGNVGIGTNSPSSKLHIKQSSGGYTSGIWVESNVNASELYIHYASAIDAFAIGATYETGGAYKPIAFFTSDLERMRITTGGVVQIAGLTSNGTVSTQSSNGSLYVSSDANLKIEDGFVENGLGKVLALKPRYFYWKDKEAFSADRQLGFYAQEVNAVSEETANTPPEGCGWGIYDRGLVALLTSAIQEQQSIITSLQDRLTKAGL